MNDPTPTVFLVDDDPSVLKAIGRLLRTDGLSVITYDSPRRFLALCSPAMHGCIVLDFAMPELNGLELQEALAERGVSLPIIFLTGRGDIPTSVRAIKGGAVDFLTKPVQEHELIAAILAAIAKDREWRIARLQLHDIRNRIASLTPREYEVLQRVVVGRMNKEAAVELGITEKTIKAHRARIMEKMRVQSLAELVHVTDQAGVGTGG